MTTLIAQIEALGLKEVGYDIYHEQAITTHGGPKGSFDGECLFYEAVFTEGAAPNTTAFAYRSTNGKTHALYQVSEGKTFTNRYFVG